MRVITTRPERCSGCKACQALCALTLFRENNLKKAAIRIIGHFPEPGVYEINICSQCGVCAENCPTEAIERKENAWVINQELCAGCNVCMEVCPTNSLVKHASSFVPIKCIACGACVEHCPRRALVWQE